MYRILFTILFVALLGSKNSVAQSTPPFDQFFTFAWDVNIPMGDKWVDETSFAGGRLEYRKMLPDAHVSLGFDFSWNSYFSYKPYQTYHVNNSSDITTDLYKYNYTLPLALTIDYYFGNGGLCTPYVGLGLGAMYSDPKLYFNIYEIAPYNWGFLVRPELGALIHFNRNDNVGLLIATRYSYSTNKEEVFNIKNLQALGFSLGLAWTY